MVAIRSQAYITQLLSQQLSTLVLDQLISVCLKSPEGEGCE